MSTGSEYSSGESIKRGRIGVILDTAALLAKYYRLLPRLLADILVPVSAVNEVRDLESRAALEEAINLNIIRVVAPERTFLEEAVRAARSVGSLHKLSGTDVEVIAVALQLKAKYSEVIVITDDYELQNTLMYIGVSFKPLRTRGIREVRVFAVYCPTCGYTPSRPSEDVCPLCGSKIVRTRVTS